MPSINKYRLPAPAKINRFLHIIGRRSDGYHKLQTLFQFLDYGDSLVFQHHDTLQLDTILPELQTENNLILKAARLLQQASGCKRGAHITLDKKLPIGGGVGGGSSNAATTLLGLNQLWQLALSKTQLAKLALTLGADVPVFVGGYSAFAEGIGEQLTPISLSEPWYVVLIPDLHINTAMIYKHEDLTRDTAPIKVASARDQKGKNDFEPLIRQLYPVVDNCLALLDNVGHLSLAPAMLSGSGSCVFAPFSNQKTAVSVLTKVSSQAKGFVAQGINKSPLHSALSQY